MALPTPTKTWQYDKNKGPYTSLPDLLYAWKTTLTTWGSAAWTVVRSSGKVGGSTWTAGAADYWATSNAIEAEGPGTAHSWIVLKQTGIATNFQVCFDFILDTAGWPTVVKVYVSASAGFTGGSTTARATATDEIECQDTAVEPMWVQDFDLSVNPARLNVFQSDDGECTRWSIWVANYQTSFWLFDKPRNPVSGWTNPWVCVGASAYYGDGGVAQRGTIGFLYSAATQTFIAQGSTRGLCYLTCESCGSAVTQAIASLMTWTGSLDSAYPIMPIGIFTTTTSVRGRLGEIYDLWWGSTAVNDGDHYPNDGTRTFVQLNDLVHTWGGGAALVRA